MESTNEVAQGIGEERLIRVSIELPASILEKFETLREEWGVPSRSDAMRRLFEQLFSEEPDEADEQEQDATAA